MTKKAFLLKIDPNGNLSLGNMWVGCMMSKGKYF